MARRARRPVRRAEAPRASPSSPSGSGSSPSVCSPGCGSRWPRWAWSPTPPPSPPGRGTCGGVRPMRAAAGGSSSPTSARRCAAGGSPGSPGGPRRLAVWVDVQAVRAGIPGGPFVGAVGLFALIGLAVAGLRAAAVWEPGASWRALLGGRRTPYRARPRRILPARRRAGRRGLSAWFIAAAGGPRPRGRRGGGRRRGGALPAPLTGVPPATGRRPGAAPLSVMPLTSTASPHGKERLRLMSPIPRRSLLKAAAVAGAAAQFSWALGREGRAGRAESRGRRRGPGDPGLAGGRRPRRRPRLHRRRALAEGRRTRRTRRSR